MAPIITIAGLKGGIGKTATAVALAAYWGEVERVLLVDADVNGSAVRWHRRGAGALPFEAVPIHHAQMAMQRSWDQVLMDTAGGSHDEIRSYAEGSSFVICPAQAAASSLEQVLDLAELLRPTGTAFAVLITMVDSRRRGDATKARQLLLDAGIPVLRSQVSLLSCWPKAEAAGLVVRDARTDTGRPDPGAAKAWEEVALLADEIAQWQEPGMKDSHRQDLHAA